MKNKFILSLFMCITMLLSVSLAGCSTTEKQTGTAPRENTEKPQNLTDEKEDTEKPQNLTDEKEDTVIPQSLTDDELLKAAKVYQGYLKEIKPRISKVWSGANPDDYNIIITNGNKNYFVSEQLYEELELADADNDLKNTLQNLQYAVGMYQNAEYKGESATVLHLTKSADDCTQEELLQNFIILMHESFHFHSQDGWNSINTMPAENEQANLRASVYPVDEKPRVLRAMIYDCLYSALNSHSEEKLQMYLSNAKYWYENWKTEYSDEYSSIKVTDLSEGTAEYFGNEIKRILTNEKAVQTPEEFALADQAADAESYGLGDLAIQLIKKQKAFEVKGFEHGSSPLEILFDNVTANTEVQENDTIRTLVSDRIQKNNKQISDYFTDYINADKNGNMTYLSIDSETLTGIMASGFYYLTDISKTGWQDSSISNQAIQVENKAVFEYMEQILIPVSESDLTIKDNKICAVNSDGLTLNNPVNFEKTEDDNGNTIYKLKS